MKFRLFSWLASHKISGSALGQKYCNRCTNKGSRLLIGDNTYNCPVYLIIQSFCIIFDMQHVQQPMVDSTAYLIFHRSFLIFNLSSIKVFLCKTSSQSCFNFITDSPYSHYYSYHRYDKDYRHILCTGQSQHAAVYPV